MACIGPVVAVAVAVVVGVVVVDVDTTHYNCYCCYKSDDYYDWSCIAGDMDGAAGHQSQVSGTDG